MSGVFDCIDSAVSQKLLTVEDGERLKDRYRNLMRAIPRSAEAKAAFAAELEAEAAQKKRLAFQVETKRKNRDIELNAFRDWRGDPDPARALSVMVARASNDGSWKLPSEVPSDAFIGVSAEEMAKLEYTKVKRMADKIAHEFRPGAIVGDLRRRFSSDLKTRSANIVRELYGEATNDPVAKALAQDATKVFEYLRTTFNTEGGEIGKLDRYAGPQAHNPTAILRDRDDGATWINYLMQPGVLNREKMVHPLTGRVLSDPELRESLKVVVDRILSDGWSDRKVTGQVTGKGALWKQHADDRFLHFASADAWMEYAKKYGNLDWYATFEHYMRTMSRDIGHMKKFGPNPEVMFEYLKNSVRAKAAQAKSVDLAIEHQTQQLETLYDELNKDASGHYRTLLAEHAALLKASEKLRTSPDGIYYHRIRRRLWEEQGLTPADDAPRAYQTPWQKALADDPRLQKVEAEMADLGRRLMEKQRELDPYEAFGQATDATRMPDPVVAEKINRLLDEMKQQVVWNPRQINMANTYAEAQIRKAETLWMHVRGQLVAPNDARVVLAWDDMRANPSMDNAIAMSRALATAPFTAAGMATQRSLTSAAVLGGAVFSSLLSDPVTVATRMSFIGMPWHRSNTFAVVIKEIQMLAASEDTKAWIRQSMVAADEGRGMMMRQAANAGTLESRGMSGYIVDRVLNWSGLIPLTEALKRVYAVEMMGLLAREAEKPWIKLDPNTREWLSQGGFDGARWNELRAMPQHERDGATFLRPNEVMERNDGLGMQYLALLQRELATGVLEGSTLARAVMLGQTKPGTLAGETMRTFWHIKTFPMTFAYLHLGQIMRDMATPGQRLRGARYAAQLMVTGTAAGLVAMALKDMAAGRDPRRWFKEDGQIDPKTMAAAFMQAGGLGIYGDFMFSNINRFGGGLLNTAAGPLVDRYDQLRNMIVGNAVLAGQNWLDRDNKKLHLGADITQFIRQNTPMIWQARLAYDRVVMDEFQKWADPEAYQHFNRQVQTRMKDYGGQQYWWAPGEPAARRSPNLGAISGR